MLDRCGQGPVDDVHPDLFVAGGFLASGRQGFAGPNHGHATAGKDAFLDRRTAGVQGVFDAGFLLFHFHFGGRANIDLGHTAGQLGQTFLELLAVVVAAGGFNLGFDLLDATLDVLGLAGPFNEGGGVLLDADLLGLAQVFDFQLLEVNAELVHDGGAAGEDRDVLQHFLASVTKAGGFDGGDLQDATELVDHEHGQGFAIDIFSDDQQTLAGFGHLSEDGQEVFRAGDLLLVDQDVAVFQICSHGRGVGDKVGTQVALVELHAFHEFDFGVEALAFFHSDDAVLAHFVHGFGNDFADLGILVGGTGADLGNLLGVTHGLAHLGQLAGNGVNPDVDATLHFVGVGTGSDVLEAFGEDGFGVNRRGGGAITGILGGLAGHFFDHLGAHVLEGVFEFNFLGDGDTIFGDGGSAKGFFKDHHAAGGAEGALHRFGKFLDATQHAFAGVNVVSNFFCGHGGFLLAHSAVGQIRGDGRGARFRRGSLFRRRQGPRGSRQ